MIICVNSNFKSKKVPGLLNLFYVLRMEFVILPAEGIIYDVFCDSVVGFRVPDNVFVESGLPGEIKTEAMRMFCYRGFVRTDN